MVENLHSILGIWHPYRLGSLAAAINRLLVHDRGDDCKLVDLPFGP